MPIRLKLALWYSGVSLFMMSLFCSYLYLFFTHREIGQIDAQLAQRAQEAIHSIKVVDAYPFPIQQLILPDMDVFSSAEMFMQITDTRGNILSRSPSLRGGALPISSEAIEKISKRETYYETKKVEQTLLRVYYAPLYTDRERIGILQVAESLTSFQRAQTTLGWLLAFGALTITAMSAIIGWLLSKKALHPIQRIQHTTELIEKTGTLEQRIDYDGPMDEIGMLSNQINRMLEKIEHMYVELEEAYDTQRRFVADASHELRTPLTSIRGNMDYLRKRYAEQGVFSDEAADDIIDELERVTRLVHDLLALARADAGYEMSMEPLSLREIAKDWISEGKKMSNGSVAFSHAAIDALEKTSIDGNRDFLRQVFLILLENAFKYTEEGVVTLSFESDETTVSCIVNDTGIGVASKEQNFVFDRFYRGSQARAYPGTGLGLSIARWIVERHRGAIDLTSKPGQGTSVIVTLPKRFA